MPESSSLVSEHPEIAPLLAGERVQRAKVLQAMVDVVAEKGYAAATVADAVRRARVSRGTFYELFDSKEACLAAGYRLGTDALARARDRGRARARATGARSFASACAPTCRRSTRIAPSRASTCSRRRPW